MLPIKKIGSNGQLNSTQVNSARGDYFVFNSASSAFVSNGFIIKEPVESQQKTHKDNVHGYCFSVFTLDDDYVFSIGNKIINNKFR